MMTRKHVALMFAQSGYSVALRVLSERNARGEFFVQLENLRADRAKADRRREASEYSGEDQSSPLSSVREMVRELIERGIHTCVS